MQDKDYDEFHEFDHDYNNRGKGPQIFPWGIPLPLVNAQPNRRKYCPVCYYTYPIASFLYLPQDKLRTLYIAKKDIVVVCANVAEWCKQCNEQFGDMVKPSHSTYREE